jgi:hypothetical protein
MELFMRTKKKISQQPFLMLSLGLISCAIFAIYFKWKQTGKLFVPETVLAFFIMLFAGIIMVFLAWRMMKYFSNKSPQQLVRQIIPAVLLFYIAWYVVSNTIISAGVFFWYLVKGFDLSNFISYLFTVEKVFVNPELPEFLLIFTIIFFYILWHKSVMREQKLREENLIFQNQTLKNQINPHFLFNSLNTLSSLVNTHTETAEYFINHLSSIYRYILENSPKDKVSLQSELEFVNDYFSLYKIRNDDKVQLNADVKEADKYEIVPVSLQLLIENAIKHNMATRENPLRIFIHLENQYILVKNNLQKIATQLKSTKTGLKNLSERIRLITGKELIIEETKEYYLVKVPLLI